MEQSDFICQQCVHYHSYYIQGGLDKLQQCTKEHKYCRGNCEDFEEFHYKCP